MRTAVGTMMIRSLNCVTFSVLVCVSRRGGVTETIRKNSSIDNSGAAIKIRSYKKLLDRTIDECLLSLSLVPTKGLATGLVLGSPQESRHSFILLGVQQMSQLTIERRVRLTHVAQTMRAQIASSNEKKEGKQPDRRQAWRIVDQSTRTSHSWSVCSDFSGLKANSRSRVAFSGRSMWFARFSVNGSFHQSCSAVRKYSIGR